MNARNLDKAALRGEPSYIWRQGQQRRLEMIFRSAGTRLKGRVLDDGCGVGMYVEHLSAFGGEIVGLEYDIERARLAARGTRPILNAGGERLPFGSSTFDVVLSHEVIEHVQDDSAAVAEMLRVLNPGGLAIIFCPNRGYPFETHGIFWRGKYRFGNMPFVNYLPRSWRNKLAPHVRAYGALDLERLLGNHPGRIVERSIIFGGYDNIIGRFGFLGKALRGVLQFLERTPLQILGLSHYWVIERT